MGTAIDTPASAKDQLCRLTYEIDGVREQSEGYKTYCRSSVNRGNSATGRERDEVKRLLDSLEEAQGIM